MKENKSLVFICRTALGIALVILAQLLSKVLPVAAISFGPLSLSQLITGSLVNCVLFVFAAQAGALSGICIGLVSSFLAFLLGIGPSLIQVVPVVACGNAILAGLFGLSCKKQWPSLVSMVGCAVIKCGFLWVAVPAVIASLGTVPEKQAAVMSAMFSWPQGVTALVGGVLALIIIPRLKKAK
jgi:uncharacterized membrane protein